MTKLSVLTDAPGGPLAGDYVYLVRGDGGSPEVFTSYRVLVDDLLGGGTVAGTATVRAATTANITIATALNNGDSLDGVTLATDDLVLVKNQSAPEENGIYVVGVSPARSADFDTYDEHPGKLITVQEGTANADKAFLCTSNKGGTLNTTAIVFAEYAGVMVGDSGSGGTKGLAPAPSSGDAAAGKFLKADGTWAVPPGSGGGDPWFIECDVLLNRPPTSNFATLDSRNGQPCLDFDANTQEAAIWGKTLPASYGGNGITVSVTASLTSATSGTLGWLVSIERQDASGLDTDSDSFASAQTITATTVPGTSGQIITLSVNISNGANMDSLAAGERFRIKIERDVSNDTATGDAELRSVTIVEQ